MTDVSNQSNQGPAPVTAPATTNTPTTVVATPNPASPEAAQATATGQTTPPVQSTSPVVASSPPAPSIDDAANPAEPLEATTEGDVVLYGPTGDPGMDMALTFVGKLGMKPDHPAMVKAAEGDFSFIKAHLATLGDKATGWEQHIALAEQAWGNQVKAQEAVTKQITAAVHHEAGGAEAWATIEAWAKKNADPRERTAINKMLGSSPIEAKAATMLLKALYEQASGTTITPAKVTPGGTPAGGDTVTNTALSPKDYAKEVAALNQRKPGAVDRKDPEYLQLQQRALAFRR